MDELRAQPPALANVRAAAASAPGSTPSSSPAASTRASRAPSRYLSGFTIVHRYAYVLAAARGRAVDRLPAPRRATSASTARRWIEAGLRPRTRASGSPTRAARAARRRLRARLRDDRARLPRARRRGRARPVRRGVRPRARREERRPSSSPCATASASTPRASASSSSSTRPGETAAEVHGRVRALLRRRGLRPPDDGHGARRAARSSCSRAATSCSATTCSRRSRSPARAATGSRSRARSASRTSDEARACSRPTRSTSRPPARRCAPGATAHDVHRAVSKGFHDRGYHARPRHRPLDRDDDDRVPEDRRGRRDRAAPKAWSSRCTRTRSRRTARAASTCRTRGSSPPDGGEPLSGLPMRVYSANESVIDR